MHRHTTNSISTASAVFHALRKLISRKRRPGRKTRPQISITTDGREQEKLMDATFPQILSLFFSFEFNMYFYCRAITAYDEEKLILMGLIWDEEARTQSPHKICGHECVCKHDVRGQEQTAELELTVKYVCKEDSGETSSGFLGVNSIKLVRKNSKISQLDLNEMHWNSFF